uniref:Uncharacterized protein n=1 Tax=viral metagenome TaxID=1070528 RepID=A0A6C0BQL6_9ZZZZ
MEINQLHYIKWLPNDIICDIYMHLTKLNHVSNLLKNELVDTVKLLNKLNDNLTYDNLFIYKQLLLFYSLKKQKKNNYHNKYKYIFHIYKNGVFYIDIHTNTFSNCILKKKIFDIWLRKLSFQDRLHFLSFFDSYNSIYNN